MRTTNRLLPLCFLFVYFTAVLSVHWVPIVDRNEDPNEITDPIEAAFQKTNQLDQIHKEKFQRVAKMLNNSLDAKAEELREGNKKLEVLRHHSSSAPLERIGCLIIATLLCPFFYL